MAYVDHCSYIYVSLVKRVKDSSLCPISNPIHHINQIIYITEIKKIQEMGKLLQNALTWLGSENILIVLGVLLKSSIRAGNGRLNESVPREEEGDVFVFSLACLDYPSWYDQLQGSYSLLRTTNGNTNKIRTKGNKNSRPFSGHFQSSQMFDPSHWLFSYDSFNK